MHLFHNMIPPSYNFDQDARCTMLERHKKKTYPCFAFRERHANAQNPTQRQEYAIIGVPVSSGMDSTWNLAFSPESIA